MLMILLFLLYYFFRAINVQVDQSPTQNLQIRTPATVNDTYAPTAPFENLLLPPPSMFPPTRPPRTLNRQTADLPPRYEPPPDYYDLRMIK